MIKVSFDDSWMRLCANFNLLTDELLNIFQTLAGVKSSFNFAPTDTILSIKQTLQEREGIDVAMIRLIFSGKALADDNTIESYNMKAGDTIHMILQLKGGFWALVTIATIMDLHINVNALLSDAFFSEKIMLMHCISAN